MKLSAEIVRSGDIAKLNAFLYGDNTKAIEQPSPSTTTLGAIFTLSFWQAYFGAIHPPLYDESEELNPAVIARANTMVPIGRTGYEMLIPALVVAARDDQPEAVECLIRAGANLNGVGPYNQTALWYAASRGHHRCTALLLKAGADPQISSNDPVLVNGRGTPLYKAAYNGHVKDVASLLDHHADPNETGTKDSIVEAALSTPSLDCLKLLVAANADVNASMSSSTPLKVAFNSGSEILACMLKAGLDTKSLDARGNHPIQSTFNRSCFYETEQALLTLMLIQHDVTVAADLKIQTYDPRLDRPGQHFVICMLLLGLDYDQLPECSLKTFIASAIQDLDSKLVVQQSLEHMVECYGADILDKISTAPSLLTARSPVSIFDIIEFVQHARSDDGDDFWPAARTEADTITESNHNGPIAAPS